MVVHSTPEVLSQTANTPPAALDEDLLVDLANDRDLAEKAGEAKTTTTTTSAPTTTSAEAVHTLKCRPASTEDSPPGTIPMHCTDTAVSAEEQEEPIVILISTGLISDLRNIDRKKVKIVVKDLMLMEMRRQEAASHSPKRR